MYLRVSTHLYLVHLISFPSVKSYGNTLIIQQAIPISCFFYSLILCHSSTINFRDSFRKSSYDISWTCSTAFNKVNQLISRDRLFYALETERGQKLHLIDQEREGFVKCEYFRLKQPHHQFTKHSWRKYFCLAQPQ